MRMNWVVVTLREEANGSRMVCLAVLKSSEHTTMGTSANASTQICAIEAQCLLAKLEGLRENMHRALPGTLCYCYWRKELPGNGLATGQCSRVLGPSNCRNHYQSLCAPDILLHASGGQKHTPTAWGQNDKNQSPADGFKNSYPGTQPRQAVRFILLPHTTNEEPKT